MPHIHITHVLTAGQRRGMPQETLVISYRSFYDLPPSPYWLRHQSTEVIEINLESFSSLIELTEEILLPCWAISDMIKHISQLSLLWFCTLEKAHFCCSMLCRWAVEFLIRSICIQNIYLASLSNEQSFFLKKYYWVTELLRQGEAILRNSFA